MMNAVKKNTAWTSSKGRLNWPSQKWEARDRTWLSRYKELPKGQRELVYCCFHFIVRDDSGPEHASHMLIKRNFSFSLGPSLPVQSKTSIK